MARGQNRMVSAKAHNFSYKKFSRFSSISSFFIYAKIKYYFRLASNAQSRDFSFNNIIRKIDSSASSFALSIQNRLSEALSAKKIKFCGSFLYNSVSQYFEENKNNFL